LHYNDVTLHCGSHEKVTKRYRGEWVGLAERDVTLTINLCHEFSNCCCQTNQSRISCWQKMNTALYLFLLRI